MLLSCFARSEASERSRVGGRLRRAARTLIASTALASVCIAPVAAQTGDPYAQRNVPYGYPVSDPASTGTTSRDRETNSDRTRSEVDLGSQIEPTEIIGPTGVRQDRNGSSYNNFLLNELATPNPRLKPLKPGEFEKYVEQRLGRVLPRFGAELLLPSNRDYAVPATASVPPDYMLGVGDVVSIALTGSVDGSVDVEIDTDGKIFLPKIGPVHLAGIRYRDLKDTVAVAVGRQYRGYTVTVGIKELRGIRVYVTGFANNPGAYSVNSLSTMVNAVLAAGGPSAGGSLRSVQLLRNGTLVSDFDLYDLILRGSRNGDAVLQNEDVLFIPPVGEQIAITGSVNAPAIYEAKAGETLEAVLAFAGGSSVLGDASRIMLYRISDLATLNGREIARTEMPGLPALGGDILQVLNKGSLQYPLDKQGVLVRVEGEVNAPGNYYVPPNTSLEEVMARAGGLTSRAFVYGTRFERHSVRQQQKESFTQAIDQLEISLAASPLSGDQLDNSGRDAQSAAARAVLERLREAEPDGRVVIDIPVNARSLPAGLLLENNDRIVIPPQPTTVGVFGAVYRPASFMIDGGKPLRVKDYVERAGGPLRSADKGEIFVVRANGAVLSRSNGALNAPVLPGDVVFVPVKTRHSSVWTKIREISTIIFQLGVSAAAFVAVAK